MMLMLLFEWPHSENHQDKGPRLKEKEVLCAVKFNYSFRFRFKYVQVAESKLASEHPSGNTPARSSSLASCFLDIFSSKQTCFCGCRSHNSVCFSNLKCLMIVKDSTVHSWILEEPMQIIVHLQVQQTI